MSTHPVAHVPVHAFTSWTIPQLVDYHCSFNPNSLFTVFPGPGNGSSPDKITYLELGRAVHRASRFFHQRDSGGGGGVVGIVASCDSLLYLTCIIGMMKAGLTPFPMSPRNSAAAICDMVRKVSAHRIVGMGPSVLLDEVQQQLQREDYAVMIEEMPLFTDVYPRLAHDTRDESFDSVPPFEGGALSADIPALYLHSSGSTGFPKPIPWRHDFIRAFSAATFKEDLIGYKKHILFATPGLPSFHMMAVAMQLLLPLYTGQPSAIFRPMFPQPPTVTTPAAILAALQAVQATTAFTVPSIIESWIHDQDALKYLSTLDQLGYAGGPLAKAAGDKLASAGCNVICLYGGTEFGAITRLFSRPKTAPEQWEWMSFLPSANIRWVPQGDGTFELQLLRCETHLQAVENLPDVRGYATSDLWLPHPEQADLWKIVGRADDVVILANGEKVVPAPTEGMLLAHPFVQGALVFGRERNFVGVLVEPVSDRAFNPTNDAELAEFRNAVWRAVEEANAQAPAFGRVLKEMILITRQEKPLPRAAKGTVNRKAAIKLYEDEIAQIYNAVENPSIGSDIPPPAEWTEDLILLWLIALANAGRDGVNIDSRVDLFQQGFDSLSATFLRNNITSALRSSSNPSLAARATEIGSNFIYANPTLQGLAAILGHLADESQPSTQVDSVSAIRSMIEKYKRDMPFVAPTSSASGAVDHRTGEVVLLTGSTGGLGSQLLASYLEAREVVHIYTLNRPSKHATLLERHKATFKDRGLDSALLTSSKLTLLEGDASQENLGLSKALAQEVQSSVTIIVHNAWQLNFNLGLSSFEPHIRGTRRLIDFAFASVHATKMRLLFTSSVSVAQSWPQDRGPYPEEPQDDPRWAVGSGYGESKYVAERLLVEAADHGLKATSLRIGQISGGKPNGAWAVTDWVPIMVASSITLGCLPTIPGVISWIPFDVVVSAILHLSLTTSNPELALNVVHPRPVSWSTIMEVIADVLVEGHVAKNKLALVGISEWVAKLTDMGKSLESDILKRVPALKLLDFFTRLAKAPGDHQSEAGGQASFATLKSQQSSTALDHAESLGQADVRRWVAYWKDKGLFTQE